MTPEHREAQRLFLDLGRALGYETRAFWSQSTPTDGVWLSPESPLNFIDQLPIAAVEVAVSESIKATRGSIDILREVSPALGIIILHEEYLLRKGVRDGGDPASIRKKIEEKASRIETFAKRGSQRIELWKISQIRRWLDIAKRRK